MKEISPVIVIHGGTSYLDFDEEEYNKRATVMKISLKTAQNILLKGGSALDAVIAAVKIMEDDPEFNAGKGAVFTHDGFNELDACIMDGKSLKVGAVALARRIKNPIEAARIVMEKTPHSLIAGQGADKLAQFYGLEMVDQKYFYTQKRYEQLQAALKSEEKLLDSHKPYLGTVGAVALDKNSNLAAATSTGGMTNKMTGRVGDSAISGAGNYANNECVAVSCTGTGDVFVQASVAHELAALYKYKKLDIQKAAQEAIKQVDLLGGSGGIIALDKNGNIGFAWTKDKLGLYHGQAKADDEAIVFKLN